MLSPQLASPHLEQHEIDVRLARAFFFVALAFGLIALAVAGVSVWRVPRASGAAMLSPVLAFFVACAIAKGLARAGRARMAAALVLAAMAAGTTAWVVLSAQLAAQPSLAPFALFPLLVLFAGALLGAGGALTAGAFSQALMLAAWFSLPRSVLDAEARPISELLILTLMIAASVGLAVLLSRAVASSLQRGRGHEQRFREILAQAPIAITAHRKGRILFANEAAAALFGFTGREDFAGTEVADLITPEHRDLVRERIKVVETMPLESSVPPAELKCQRRDGAPLTVQAMAIRIGLEGGPANLSLYCDLTALKRSEAALRRSETMLQTLFKASPDYVTVTTVQTGRYVLINDAFTRIIGYTREEAIGRTGVELGIWASKAKRDEMVAEMQRTGLSHNYPMQLRSKQGVILNTLMSAASIDHDGEQYLIAHVRDITENELMRLEYGSLMENIPLGVAFTRDRVFHHANPHWERLFGWEAGTLAGQPGSILWPSIQEYEEAGSKYGPLLAQGKAVDFECLMRRRDGSLFECRARAQVIDSSRPAAGGTIWIAEDITERRRFEKALADARDEAQAASKAKSNFLAAISHELRTPLNGLLGLSRLGLDPKTSTEQTREYLVRMHESAQSLSSIVSDLLDLTKIEAGKLTIESVAFDPREAANNLYRAYRDLAAETGLLLSLHVDSGVPEYVRGDPLRVRQILGNFLSNALKFTAQGRVDIRLRRLGGDVVRLEVEDTGIGIEEAVCEKLFTPFSQADDSTTRKYGGTGLGLAICRQLATLMGGQVGADSRVGAGSTFWAELPLPATAAPLQAAAAPVASLEGLRVLLVEDNPVNKLVAEALLRRWGIEVVYAEDGRAALAAVDREYARPEGYFNVVLMDVHMPNMTGPEATVELRKRFSRDDLPIIALTAALFTSEQEQYLNIGMNECVAKPIEPALLHAALSRWGLRATAAQ